MNNISFDDFMKIEICVGTILTAEINNNLNNPAIVLRRVVLPDNVRPKIVYKFPFLKLKETSLR